MNFSTRTTSAGKNCQNTSAINTNKTHLLVKPALLMRWFFVLMILTAGTFVNNVFAQTNGIYESYAILSLNGGANAYYDMNAATANPDFQGAALGNFSFAQSLVVKGGQNKTFKCSGGDISNGRLNWRVWKTSSGASGAFSIVTMGFISNDAGGCGGNQTWEGTGGATNVITGLLPGNYTLEVYSDADGVPGTTFSNNGGANYKATFNVTAPNPVFLYEGVNTGGGTYYATVKDAFDAINLGTYTGVLHILLYANTTETASAVLNANGSGAAVYSSLSINPDAGSAITVSGAITGHMIDLNGADNVTVDGLNTFGNSLTISNTGTGASSAIRFIGDATNNTIQKCTISGSASTAGNGVIFFSLGNTTGNDNNNINNCNITAAGANLPINCIYSLGSTITIDNSLNTINANNISNFGNATLSSRGINVDATGNSTWTITNNKIFQTATRTTSGGSVIGILVSIGAGYTITGNVVGFANSAGTGTTNIIGAASGALGGTFPGSYTIGTAVGSATGYRGINCTFNATGVVSTIQNNTIAGVALFTGTGQLYGIGVFAGNANITGNTIGSTTGVGSIYTACTTSGTTDFGIAVSSATTVSITNNTVGAMDAMGASSSNAGGLQGINIGGSGVFTVTGNTIGNSTNPNLRMGTLTDGGGNLSNTGVNFGIATGASLFKGITSTVAAPGVLTIGSAVSPNTVRNVSNNTNSATAATSGYRGIEHIGTGTLTIRNNTITGLTSATAHISLGNAQLAGLGILASGATTPVITGNTINNLALTNIAGTNLAGISFTISAGACEISLNKIYDLRNASTATSTTAPGTVSGVYFRQPSTATIALKNNMISLGNAQATNTSFIGIWAQVGTAAVTFNLNTYFNTINIEGTATSGAQPSFCFYRGNFSTTAMVPVVDIRNNIFNNTRTSTGAGTGKHYAISNNYLATAASTTGWGTNASNYNVLNATAATIGYWNADNTMATWRTASAGDATGASITAIPVTFVNTVTGDLHLNMGVTLTQLESGAVSGTGVTTDFDNQTRPGPTGSVNGGASAPDFGADEFDGSSTIPVITALTIAPAGYQCVASAHTITANIVPTSGTIASATINYSLNGVAQTGIVMTGPAGGGVWTGVIPVAAPVNAIVRYSITATNTLPVSVSTATLEYQDQILSGAVATVSAVPGTVCSGSPSILTAIITSNIAAPTGYCVTGYANTDEDDIGQVTFAGINNPAVRPTPQTGNAAAANTYTDFTAIAPATVTPGSTYPMTIYHFHDGTDQSVNSGAVYIDFNQNGSFLDAGEKFTLTKTGGFYADFTGNILIPATARPGNTRMRVIVEEGASIATACGIKGALGASGWGEAEDYIVNITVPVSTIIWDDGTNTVGNTNPTTVNPTAATTYQANITTLGGCPIVSNTVTVTTIALPASPVASNSSQCGSGIPTAAVGTGGQNGVFRWYSASTGGSLLQTGGSTYTTSINTTTTFYVSEDDGLGGCQSLRTPVIVTVNSPDIVVATSNGPVCANSPLTLTANVTVQNSSPASNYTYTWSAAAGSGITGTTPGGSGTFGGGPTNTIVTPTVGNTYIYTVNAVDPAPGGCATSATVSVLVRPQPVIDSVTATPAAVCAGGSSILRAYTNITTSGPAGLPGTYCVANHSNGAAQSEITSVAFGTINNAPIQVAPWYTIYPATGSTTTNVTRGNTYPLTLVTNAAIFQSISGVWFDWNRDGIFDASEFTQPWLSGTSGTVNILIPVTASLGQTGMRIRTRTTTNALTANDACITIGSGSTHDYTINVVNVVTQDPALTYTWNNGAGTGSTVTVTLPTPPSQSYTVTVLNPATTCSSTGNVTVTVNPVPTVPTATGSEQCGSGIPTASVTSTSGAPTPIFKWYDAPTAGNLLQTGTSVTYLTSISVTTTFYVSEISAAGCEGPRVAVLVTVTDPDPLTVTSSTGPDACTGETFTISSSYTPDFNVFASFILTASPLTGSGLTGPVTLVTNPTGSNPYSVSPTAPGAYVYTITATDPDKGCASVSAVTVTMHNYPVVDSLTTSPSPATVCAGTPVTLNVYSALTTTGPQTAPAGYGVSSAQNPEDEEIFNVTLSTLNQSSTCLTTGGPASNGLPASVLKQYSNYTGSVSAPTLHRGQGYPISVTTSSSCGANFGMRLGIYVDWNRDGDFNDLSEIFFEDAAIVTADRTVSGTITIPAFAQLGKTLFRIVAKEQDVPSATGTYGWGETEDYLINIDNVQLPNPNLTFSWNNGGGAGNTVVVTPLTTTTYTASLNEAGCITNATPVTVTVNPVPTVPTATNSTQCGPGAPAASVTSTSGLPTPIYKWYDSPAGGILLQSSTSNTYTTVISATTTFYVSEATAAGCESASRVTVTATVTAAPALTITPGGPTSFCIGGSVSLAASGSGYTSFAWTAIPSAGSGIASPSSATTLVTPTVSGAIVYTVTANGGGCQNITSVTVNSNPYPVIDSVHAIPSTICVGASSTLSAFSSVTLTGPQGLPGVYCVPVNSNIQGTARITDVSFNTLSNLNIVSGIPYYDIYPAFGSTTTTVIRGNTYPINLSSSTPSIISVWIDWDRNGIFDNTEWYQPWTSATTGSLNITIPVGATLGQTGMRIRTRTDGNINGDFNACTTFGASGSSQDYTINIINQVLQNPTHTYTWATAPAGANTVVSPVVTTAYTPTVTSAAGCATVGSPVTVTVTTVSSAASASPNPTCLGTAVTVSANATGGGPFTYSWSDGGPTVYPATASITVNPATATTYTVIVTDVCLNAAAPSSVTVTVNPLPTASIQEGPGPLNVCTPGTQLLTAVTNAGSATYQWTLNGANIPAATGATYTVSAVSTGTYRVIVTNTATGCISAPSTGVVVTINPIPGVVTITPPAATICTGASQSLTASALLVAGDATATTGTISIPIPDLNTTGISSSLVLAGVPAGAIIDSVVATYSITHSFDQEIIVNLEAPNGQILNLIRGFGILGGANFTNTRISSDNTQPAVPFTGAPFTGTYRADGTLAGFDITPSPLPTTSSFSNLFGAGNGTWKLRVYDDRAASLGTLTNFSLKVSYHSSPVTYAWTPLTALTPANGLGATVSAAPLTTTTYTATATNGFGCANSGAVTVTVADCPVTVNLKLFLQGYYAGGSTMQPVLNNQGVAALATETDSVLVELHDPTTFALVDTKLAVLSTSGMVSATFAPHPFAPYVIAVKHRSTVQTWSKNPVTVNGASPLYDFSLAANMAAGDNQASLGGGVFGFYTGDLNQDDFIDGNDFPQYDFESGSGGLFDGTYTPTDMNGDGFVDSNDFPVFDTNIFNGVTAVYP